MVFNSIEFAIFLPAAFLLYWFVFSRSCKLQNIFILAASYLFYGWWDWRFLSLIAFTSLCSWASGLHIERRRNEGGNARAISVANIVVNLAILCLFKYHDFFAESFARCFLGGRSEGLLLHLILPVGISFYTFQALSYSIDVYRGKIAATRDIVQFFAYVSFFPQLVAGPIERASNLLPQFAKPRRLDAGEAIDGVTLALWGLFKKMVLADNCAIYVDAIFSSPQGQSGSTLLLAAILFALQIYGDFSGYSDIAIGTARLFGIKLSRNFNVPYFSRDIAEFWRRWHISLTTWFRDYVYIPLGGSRCSKAKVIRNTFVIFLLSGLWHGANWTFLAWGAYHALLFLPLIVTGRNRRNTGPVAEGRALPSAAEFGKMLLTFQLVTIGWIFFRADSVQQACSYIAGIFDSSLFSAPAISNAADMVPIPIAIIAVAIVEWTCRNNANGACFTPKSNAARIIFCTLTVLLTIFFGASSDSFIYFQF